MLFCAVCVGWLMTSTKLRPTRQGVLWTASALVLAGVSAGLAASPSQALRELSLWGGLICIAACFAGAGTHFNLRVVLPFLSIGAACYALLVVLMAGFAAGSQQAAQFAPDELFFGFNNYRFYNHVQTVSLPLLAYVAGASSSRKSVRWLAFVGLSCSFGLLWLSMGRATTVAVVLAAMAAVGLARQGGWRWVKLLIAGACLGAVISFAITHGFNAPGAVSPVGSGSKLSHLTSDHSRLLLWGLAWDQIQSAPWLGIGPQHMASQINAKAAHPHNIYLQIAAEFGLPMVMLVAAAAGICMWKMARSIRACADEDQRFLGVALWGTCLAIAIDGLFSGNFVMPLSQCWIAAAIGLAVAWHRQARSDIQEKTATSDDANGSRTSHMRWLGLLVVLPPLWLIYEVQPEATNLQAHLAQVHRDLASNERINPRFWSHGWFRP